MNVNLIVDELKQLGRESTKRVLLNHGAHEPCFGVKIEDLKKIQKRKKQDHSLALDLYKTGIYDAMYLAGLMADDARMSKSELRSWVEKASGPLAGSTVAWVAAGSAHGFELAREWINSDKEFVAAAGWATLSSLVSIKEDADLDLAELKQLLDRVQRTIHASSNLVRYQMNGFVIAVGGYVRPLSSAAKEVGKKIGAVSVDFGGTMCRVPFAPEYIQKMEQRGVIGKKRKTAKC
jgi:3-methyladenine DNA glycosylase AlkD